MRAVLVIELDLPDNEPEALTVAAASLGLRSCNGAVGFFAAIREDADHVLAVFSKGRVNECPDCGQAGRYEHRVTIGGRGYYQCPDGHQWQDAREVPAAKGTQLAATTEPTP